MCGKHRTYQDYTVFSNSKPWINPDIQALIKEKRRAFKSGNKDGLKTVHKDLRRKIREGKNTYRRKMEDQLEQKDVCGVWRGLKIISGYKKAGSLAAGGQKS